MKSTKFAVSAFIFAFALTSFASAQAQTASLTLSGIVPVKTFFSMTEAAGVGALDLSKDLDIPIATVVEQSNKRTGYTVTLLSANAVGSGIPHLKGADVLNTETLDYSISYGLTGSIVPMTFDAAGVAILTAATAKTPKLGLTKTVQMSLLAATNYSNPNADTYSDTLTFTFTVN